MSCLISIVTFTVLFYKAYFLRMGFVIQQSSDFIVSNIYKILPRKYKEISNCNEIVS